MATVIVFSVVVILLVLDVKYLMKHGMEDCTGSCGDCGGCGGSCKFNGDIQKARRSIERKKKIKAFLHIS